MPSPTARSRASDSAPDLTYQPIDAGHFMAEEDPATVTDFLRRLLAA